MHWRKESAAGNGAQRYPEALEPRHQESDAPIPVEQHWTAKVFAGKAKPAAAEGLVPAPASWTTREMAHARKQQNAPTTDRVQ